ncbi:TonB-dependent receptor [Formosa sp. Hel1_33_131]|uniref:TonB-dependent receptor n=1 Tax=Formosa sp. Hel1_33_131 TaxID=1336794 RepID=UPI00084E1D9B|nr:TonB-dependent receptor [Formosa sp. Hel1_33_131]
MKLKNYFFLTLFLVSFSALAQTYEVSGIVTDDYNDPLAGVSVSVRGTTNGTSSDLDGSYSLSVSQGDVLVYSYIGFNSKEMTMDGGSTVNVVLSSGVSLDEVVVGSRNANRTAVDTPVPVDVIDISELTTLGPQVNINQILNYVAPSFASNTQTISDGTDHINPASLRGLGPDQVLVLINGKRRHTTSLVNVNGTVGRGSVGTDLNAIPSAAISRVEILRDGASAQYGSDAIAGVINIVLKKNTNELAVNVTSGANFSSNANSLTGGVDGETVNASINYGIDLGDNGGYINFTGDIETRKSTNRMERFTGDIFHGYNAIQRVAAASGANVDNLSFDQMQFFAQGVDYFTPELQSAIGAATSQADLVALLSDSNGPIDFTEAELTARGQKREDYNMRVGQSNLRSGRFMANISLPIGDNGTEFYAFGGLSYRKGNAGAFYRLPNQSRSYSNINLNGFLPNINSDIKDKSLAVGIKGKAGDWDIDFSNTWGKNSFDFTVSNSFNASQGIASSSTFTAGGFAFSQNTTNLDVSKFFENTLEGLNVAFGAEYRLENYQILEGEEASHANYDHAPDFFGRSYQRGSQGFPGFRPENALSGYRNSAAAYLDIEADITSKFLLTGALRFESYSDFGSTLNFKIASRYKLSDSFNLRGAVSTGFRAPSLHQIYYNATATQFNNKGKAEEVGVFTNDSRVADEEDGLGIPQLKQEESASASVGFTANLSEANIKIAVDGYFIAVEDRVTLTDTFSAYDSDGNPISTELVKAFKDAGAGKAAFFANAIDTETKGLDVVITHKGTINNTRIKTDLSGSFSQTRQVDDIHASQILVNGGQLDRYFSESSRIFLEDATVNQKVNLSHTISFDKWNLFLRNVYFGEVTSTTGQEFASKIVTDLSASYDYNDSVTFTVGANNLLDMYPDKNSEGNTSDGRFIFSRRAQQFGTNGRFLFARLSINLK